MPTRQSVQIVCAEILIAGSVALQHTEQQSLHRSQSTPSTQPTQRNARDRELHSMPDHQSQHVSLRAERHAQADFPRALCDG
jgi:hypothetical protein